MLFVSPPQFLLRTSLTFTLNKFSPHCKRRRHCSQAMREVVSSELVRVYPADRDGAKRKSLYPAIDAYRTGFLKVSGKHTIYFEESGNPSGKPVCFLHGGPGGGCDSIQRRFFDPSKYRIILWDQRGCGRSTPHACVEENTTWDLVNDMELIRTTLGIEQWQLFGGSWGSTLALLYAQSYPERVTEMVLRGIFLLQQQEIDWFYEEGGAQKFFPDAWDNFMAPLNEQQKQGSIVQAYYGLLVEGSDEAVRQQAARAWAVWEGSTSRLLPDPSVASRFGAGNFALAFSRIECHYFKHNGFLDSDSQILDNAHSIQHIPTSIVQGRYDVVCPVINAYRLHKALPRSRLVVVGDAGHSAFEPGMINELVQATDNFALDQHGALQ